jgi:hypothetical protein
LKVQEEVGSMGDGIWIVILSIAALIALAMVETAAYWNVGGWLDVRSARTAEDVRRNIEEYGPDAPGLKLGLLPEEERQAVLAARKLESDRREGHGAG